MTVAIQMDYRRNGPLKRGYQARTSANIDLLAARAARCRIKLGAHDGRDVSDKAHAVRSMAVFGIVGHAQ